jgi:hypothetical protein
VKSRDIFGPKPAKRARKKKPPPAKTRIQRLIGKVSTAPAPKRVLPTAVGPGPDPALVALFDGADGLGECNRRLKVARPELDEAARFALLRKHFNDVNIRWLASSGRKERVRMACRHSTGREVDFVDDDDGPDDPKDDD